MKYCTQCGTQLKDEAKFCSNCGVEQLQKNTVTTQIISNQNADTPNKTKEYFAKNRHCYTIGAAYLAAAIIVTIHCLWIYEWINDEEMFAYFIIGCVAGSISMYSAWRKTFLENLEIAIIKHSYDTEKHKYYKQKLNLRRALFIVFLAVLFPVSLIVGMLIYLYRRTIKPIVNDDDEGSLSEMK